MRQRDLRGGQDIGIASAVSGAFPYRESRTTDCTDLCFLQLVVPTLEDLLCALGFLECYHTLRFEFFRFLLSLFTLMTSGQVLLTRCEPSPALPSSLDEGQIWKAKVNSGSSFYRARAVWLDPGGGTEGKKVRRVPYFMAARIASCACRFATPEQHAAVRIAPTWSITRARGSYLRADAILRV